MAKQILVAEPISLNKDQKTEDCINISHDENTSK